MRYNLKDYNSKCDVCLSPCTDKHSEFFFPVCYSDERCDLTPFVTYIANHEIYSTNLDKPLIPIDDQFIIIKALLNKSNSSFDNGISFLFDNFSKDYSNSNNGKEFLIKNSYLNPLYHRDIQTRLVQAQNPPPKVHLYPLGKY